MSDQVDQVSSFLQQEPREGLIAILDDHVVEAWRRDDSGFAVVDFDADHVLQFDGDMFDDVAEVGAAMKSLDEAAGIAEPAVVLGKPWEQCEEAVGEPSHPIAVDLGEVFEFDPCVKDRTMKMHVRTWQRPHHFDSHKLRLRPRVEAVGSSNLGFPL